MRVRWHWHVQQVASKERKHQLRRLWSYRGPLLSLSFWRECNLILILGKHISGKRKKSLLPSTVSLEGVVAKLFYPTISPYTNILNWTAKDQRTATIQSWNSHKEPFPNMSFYPSTVLAKENSNVQGQNRIPAF